MTDPGRPDSCNGKPEALLKQAARARQIARQLAGDPAAERLEQYADELTAQAKQVLAQSAGHNGPN